MQRMSYDLEPSAMYYHNGMVNASYMHDEPPMDPRYFWPPPTSGAGGPFNLPRPPGYSNPFTPPQTDEKPSRSGTQRSEASTSTEASTNTDSEPTGVEASASGGATGGAMAADVSKEELTLSSGESSTQTAPMQDIDLLD